MASPLIQSHPCAPKEGLVARANARILHPCRASARAVSPPIPPVAPSTRAIRVDSGISSSLKSIIDRLYLPLIDSAVNKKTQNVERPSISHRREADNGANKIYSTPQSSASHHNSAVLVELTSTMGM